ncbi:MAG: hypothetical protein K9N09_05220 [Candidatus Cloacimonetes bacterium]|nr:hypothetical protein [Candidatus Cloacimonadota bacterium]MCF7883506.1 hypothetical protein [Candidatus Cloacimonadota bacterium]
MKIVNISSIYENGKSTKQHHVGFTVSYDDGSFINIIEYFNNRKAADVISIIKEKRAEMLTKIHKIAKADLKGEIE